MKYENFKNDFFILSNKKMSLSFESLMEESEYLKDLRDLRENTSNDFNIEYVQQFKSTPILKSMINEGLGVNDMNFNQLLELANELDFLQSDNFLDPILLILYQHRNDTSIKGKIPKPFLMKAKGLEEIQEENIKLWRKLILHYISMTSFKKDLFLLKFIDESFLLFEICYFSQELNINIIQEIIVGIETGAYVNIYGETDSKKTVENEFFIFCKNNSDTFNIKYSTYGKINFVVECKPFYIFELINKVLEIITSDKIFEKNVEYLPEFKSEMNKAIARENNQSNYSSGDESGYESG